MGPRKELTIRWANTLQVVLDLPALEIHVDRIFIRPNQFGKLRRFLAKTLPTSDAALEGGTFTITVLASIQGRQRSEQIVLARWKAGESIAGALEDAAKNLKRVQAEASG